MLRKSMCNNCLETYIGVRRTCIVCGLSEEWEYDLETVQRDIVNDAKDDGWYVGSHGLKCPKCYEKRKPRSRALWETYDNPYQYEKGTKRRK